MSQCNTNEDDNNDHRGNSGANHSSPHHTPRRPLIVNGGEFYTLAPATKQAMQLSRDMPGCRVFQIGRLLPGAKRASNSFRAGRQDQIVAAYILNGDECNGLYPNLLEYIHGNTRVPLVLDVEFIVPHQTDFDDMYNVAGALVDALVMFIATSLRHGSQDITRDDVCVERSCKLGKASFHIKIPKLVFASLERDM